MLTIFGGKSKQQTRRDVLRIGGLAFAGLTLADVLRLRAESGTSVECSKSVIMIWLRGGPSHIDSYDMKPDAPAEIRGEFKPMSTNVPGIQICDLMPRQAQIMDKLAVVRGIKSNDLGDHTPHYIMTGFPDRGKRPVFGAIVSHLRPRSDGLPPYVSLMYEPPGLYDTEGPAYLGHAHRPFVPKAEGLANLGLAKGVSLNRQQERGLLLKDFDSINRAVDTNGSMDGMDEYTKRAMAMVATPKVRAAFDMAQEPDAVRGRYGKYSANMLLARRLVEAGVNVVTLKIGDWDTHEKNFIDMRDQCPQLDQGIHALVTDLYERGLDKDVAVVVWGEFGRAPKISRGDGRDHWPEAGAALLAGGGFHVGQVIGETERDGGRSKGNPYTPANILSSLYRHLGIDPAAAIPDRLRRPMHVLDDRDPVRELH